MVSLHWRQVHAWRLSLHSLRPRADRQKLREVVTRIGSVHAQMMSAAYLIQVDMFAPPSAGVKRGIQAEAARLGEFLGTVVELVYAKTYHD